MNEFALKLVLFPKTNGLSWWLRSCEGGNYAWASDKSDALKMPLEKAVQVHEDIMLTQLPTLGTIVMIEPA